LVEGRSAFILFMTNYDQEMLHFLEHREFWRLSRTMERLDQGHTLSQTGVFSPTHPARRHLALAGVIGRGMQVGAHHSHFIVFFVKVLQQDVAQRNDAFQFPAGTYG